jgi:autotransporter-associated beta strand protein
MNVRPFSCFTRAALTSATWIVLAVAALAVSPKPELTATGVIAALKGDTKASPPYSQTYNLGSTNLRGWIYTDPNNAGQQGLITALSRQILVTVVESTTSDVLAVDDVILGAMAGNSGDVPLFASDCRKAFGVAIGDSEKTGAGMLRVKRWRGPFPGTIVDVNFPMTIMGDYSATAPFNCPKSDLILANARAKLIAETGSLSGGYGGAIDGLALLACVPSSDLVVKVRLRNFAHLLAPTNLNLGACTSTWDWGYTGIFLSEYYLRTVEDGEPDASVLHGITQYTVGLAKAQSRYGTFGQGGSALKPDGSLHGAVPPYGSMNAAGIPANIAIVLGKKALSVASRLVSPNTEPQLDPEIDSAITRGSDFYQYYVNKGPIPYGEHEPYIDNSSSGHASNGKDAMCAVLFGMQENRATQAQYFSRMATAGFTGREYGHTGQGFSYLWGALGANMGGQLAVTEYMKKLRWHFDLERRTDGSFVYDGQEQYGGGRTEDSKYLGPSGYYSVRPTASYILSYAVAMKRLYLTGKKDIGSSDYTLNTTQVAHAIAAATFKQDCINYPNNVLINALSDYDPVVRNDAARRLGIVSMSAAEISALIVSITDGTKSEDPNTRMGACQALGARAASGALTEADFLTTLTALSQRLSDSDLWVRAKAANALRSCGSGASSQVVPMLAAFAKNATDPDNIDWDDPIQISNGLLSFPLFGDGGDSRLDMASVTLAADKNYLYPAVKAGLKQPDSKSRKGVTYFTNSLSLADAQALTPNLFEAATSTCQADTMWHADARAFAISALARFQMAEAIPMALAMQDPFPGFGWGVPTCQIAGLNALATYGDAARWTLPALRNYARKWSPISDEYKALIATIASIEASITSPTGISNFNAVANSQIVVTGITGVKAVTLSGSSCRSTPLTYLVSTQPTHGTLTGTAPNLNYTPSGNYTGPDSFTYRVTDVLTTSEFATVSIIVGTAGSGLRGEYFDEINFTNRVFTQTDPEVNFSWGTGSPGPLVGADTFSARWSGFLSIPETGTYTFSTLTSDGVRFYIDGVRLIDSFVDQSSAWRDSVSVSLTAGQLVDLQMDYYENTGSAVAKLKWTGPSFAGRNGSIIGKEWLLDGSTVTSRTPYAHAQGISMFQNVSQQVTLTGSGVSPIYKLVGSPIHGILEGNPPNLIYTPFMNFAGTDSFAFKVTDSLVDSAIATVTVKVVQTNYAPVANSQSISLAAATTQDILLSGSDVDGDMLNYRIINGPSKGSLAGIPPNVIYSANSTYTGPDSFSFVVNDGLLDSAVGTVLVTLTPPNIAPVAIAQSVSTAQNIAKSIIVSATDANGGQLTYTIVKTPTHGSLTGTPPAVTYSPNTGYNGDDSFLFKANDGLANSEPARVSLTVTKVGGVNAWLNDSGGTWSQAPNWDTAPTSVGSTVLAFNTSGTYTASDDVVDGFTLNQILFGGSSVTLAGNVLKLTSNGVIPAQINQNSSQVVSISSPISLATTVEVGGNGAGTVTLSGPLSGLGGLTKTSAGSLILLGNDSAINGLTKVNSGNLLLNGGKLISGGMSINGGNVSLTGAGTSCVPSFTALGLTVGSSTSNNALTIAGGAIFLPALDRTMQFGSGTATNENIVTVSGSGSALGDPKNVCGFNLGSSSNGSDTSSSTGGNRNEVRLLAGGVMYSGSSRYNRSIIGTNSNGNKVTVDGSGSVWNICPGNLYLGAGGAADVNNGLVISNGGRVNMRILRYIGNLGYFYTLNPQFANIGNADQASANYVSVTGTGSNWDMGDGQINIGGGGITAGQGGAIAGKENSLKVTNGGVVFNLNWLMVGNSSAAANGNNVLLQSGGILDVSGGVVVGTATTSGNRLNVNTGGILQFRSVAPNVTIGGGSGNGITFKNGTLSYKSVVDVDMSANKTTGVGVGQFIWTGFNTFRLDGSTDTDATPYTFANNLGATNYISLELLGNTAITRPIHVDGSHGGSLYLSGASATLAGGITLIGSTSVTASVANSVLTGVIKGTGDLVKTGNANLTLNSTPTYSGNTTIVQGSLKLIKANSSNQSSIVTIANTGAALELGFNGTDTVGQLIIGNTRMAAGVYKSSTNTGSGIAIQQLVGTGTLTVLVQSTEPYSYQTWAAAAAQGLVAGVNDGGMADPDQDGIPNMMEFTLGGAPKVASKTILPVLTKTASSWTFEYNRSDMSLTSGMAQYVEYGDRLTGWTTVTIPATSSGIVEIIPGVPSDHVKVTIPTTGNQVFARLKISQ